MKNFCIVISKVKVQNDTFKVAVCTDKWTLIKIKTIVKEKESVSEVFRPFMAFFAFWRHENWGERNTYEKIDEKWQVERGSLAPIFARSKSEKCFKPAESPVLRKRLLRRKA